MELVVGQKYGSGMYVARVGKVKENACTMTVQASLQGESRTIIPRQLSIGL